MSFPHGLDTLTSTYGYHPSGQDIALLVKLVQVGKLLVLGSETPDVIDEVGTAGFVSEPPAELPRGIYWFATTTGADVLLVQQGTVPGPSSLAPLNELHDEHALAFARGWMNALWTDASRIPVPAFALTADVLTRSGELTAIRARRFSSGTWLYEARIDGRVKQFSESQLSDPPTVDDPTSWIQQPPAPAHRFTATLTRAKLEGSISDTMFSFRATRTLFRPYQFKPVLKLIQTGGSRLLIADEVGLGKTIEAGLIWTELEARHSADRVLIVCPSSLVAKWRREMDERFNFEVTELGNDQLREFEERATTGRLPRRGCYIGSLERLRKWDGLPLLAQLQVQFDLVIVDEAHYMRNVGTRSNALGGILSEVSDNLVFLSATPLNLRSSDLFNLVDLLVPGTFGDIWTFEKQLQPNAVLHRVGESLTDRGLTGQDRLGMLDELHSMTFGRTIEGRPEMKILRDLLSKDQLLPEEVVRVRRLLADLNAMSTTITRTRKVEVQEDKTVRRPHLITVQWQPSEQKFYELYLEWCEERARTSGTALGFAMQMPLRLASACLPAARDLVLEWGDSEDPSDDESGIFSTPTASTTVPPSRALRAAAESLKDVDSKYEALERQVRELAFGGKQALLFTFSRPTLAYLHKRLSKSVRVAVLHGGVNKVRRQEVIASFRAGAYDIVLANRVASEGLDFEFCSAVINYDLPWNPMEVEQRIGRIDRMGQQEPVISIINFYNPETIDGEILMRVLDRIGVFERSIGALEPIVQTKLSSLQEAVLDFTLSSEEREYKANQVLEAIEAEAAGVEELVSAASLLLVSDDVDVRGMEQEILRSGRYVGAQELASLVDDWAVSSGATPTETSGDGRVLSLRGNADMAHQLRTLASSGRRTSTELQELIAQLSSELTVHVNLDQELARTSGGSLLTANHPLVLGALSVPDFQQARFADIRLTESEDLPAGEYLVQLAVARWTGIRPGSSIWGAVSDLTGSPQPTSIVDGLLSALASGGVRNGQGNIPHSPLVEALSVTSDQLARKQVSEETLRAEESQALIEARRVGLALQHQRKLESIATKMNTAREGGKTRVIPLFEAQLTAATARLDALMAELDSSVITSVELTPLAVCRLVVDHG